MTEPHLSYSMCPSSIYIHVHAYTMYVVSMFWPPGGLVAPCYTRICKARERGEIERERAVPPTGKMREACVQHGHPVAATHLRLLKGSNSACQNGPREC